MHSYGGDSDDDEDDFGRFSGSARPTTGASMYDMDEMRSARTAAAMYDEMRSARTAASMYDEAVMHAARTAASMHDEPEIRAFSNPYSRPTTSKSFRPSLAATKASFPKPLFPTANTASAFGEYWE